MLLAPKYYPEAERHARNQDCPDCWGSGTLDYVADDDNVLVCSNCKFSVEDYDLSEAWIEAYLNEYGVEELTEEDMEF